MSLNEELPLISICIPVLNEEENLPRLIEELQNLTIRNKERCNFEFVFTDNASTDDTWKVLQTYSNSIRNLRAFRFSKNIGFQNSILYNYRKAQGSALVQLDADLQDPAEVIDTFISKWLEGHNVVNGVRRQRKESLFMSWFRKIGYWGIDALSEHPIKRNVGDFRLIDRQIIDAIIQMRVPRPYIRGMISKLGVAEFDVEYDRKQREHGESKFGVIELTKLGMTALSNHSNLPLRVSNLVGGSSLVLSLIGLIYYISLKFFQPDLPRGFASLYVLILFGIGVNTLILGVIGNNLQKYI